jgi:hypothetical protein
MLRVWVAALIGIASASACGTSDKPARTQGDTQQTLSDDNVEPQPRTVEGAPDIDAAGPAKNPGSLPRPCRDSELVSAATTALNKASWTVLSVTKTSTPPGTVFVLGGGTDPVEIRIGCHGPLSDRDECKRTHDWSDSYAAGGQTAWVELVLGWPAAMAGVLEDLEPVIGTIDCYGKHLSDVPGSL